MAWNTDDIGTRRFTSSDAPGWTIVVYADTTEAIVEAPDADTQVAVTPEGIQVFGETDHGYYSGYSAVRFTVPWAIVREVIRFQDSVQSST